MTVPTGIITMWNDVIANIPSGWALCNGSSGTPDLRSLFVYGASSDAEVGTTGGASTHIHTGIPFADNLGHNHGVGGSTGTSGTAGATTTSGGASISSVHSHSYSGSTDTTGGHNHTVPDADASSNIPLNIKMFYIMKL